MNELGKKVKEIRKANKLSQQAFADALGYSHKSVINKIESGQRDMSYEKILLMVKVFNLDIKDVEDMVPKKKTKPKKIKKEKRLAVYIHGYISGTDHTPFYSSFLNKYDFKNLDYKDGIPWEVGPIIKEEFEKLIQGYDEVIVIAKSLGAFYTFQYLSSYNIKKAFFISPLTDMYQFIFDLMNQYHVTEKQLKEKKLIKLENGFILSYDFYRQMLLGEDDWKVKTYVLYGLQDRLIYLENVADFVANHDATLTIKAGADHAFHEEENQEFIKKWILANL